MDAEIVKFVRDFSPDSEEIYGFCRAFLRSLNTFNQQPSEENLEVVIRTIKIMFDTYPKLFEIFLIEIPSDIFELFYDPDDDSNMSDNTKAHDDFQVFLDSFTNRYEEPTERPLLNKLLNRVDYIAKRIYNLFRSYPGSEMSPPPSPPPPGGPPPPLPPAAPAAATGDPTGSYSGSAYRRRVGV